MNNYIHLSFIHRNKYVVSIQGSVCCAVDRKLQENFDGKTGGRETTLNVYV